MINYDGKTIDEALPSMPVEILGMNSSAYAGAEFVVTEDEDEAKKMSEFKRNNLSNKKVWFQRIKPLCSIPQKKKMN